MNLILNNLFMEAFTCSKEVYRQLEFSSPIVIKPTVKIINRKQDNILSNVSFPSSEDKLIDMVKDAFSYDLPYDNGLSKDLIDTENRKTLKVFQKPSRINLNVISVDLFSESINYLISILCSKSPTFQILSLNEAIGIVSKNSSSCFPLRSKKNSSDAISLVSKFYSAFREMSDPEKFRFIHSQPSYIFNRFTTRLIKDKDGKLTPKVKVRVVWGIPHFINVLECMYFKWFSDHFKDSLNGFFTGNDTALEKSHKIGIVRNMAMNSGMDIFCGDVSGFDQSVSFQWFRIFLGVLEKIRVPANIKKMFSNLISYNIFTPFIDIDGNSRRSYGKVTSGSYLTTFLNTFIMFIICSYTFFSINGRFPKVGEMLVQGDDFVMLVPHYEDKSKLLKYVKDIFVGFGLRLKILDQSISYWYEDIEFLGYFWNIDNEPDQSDEWILAKLCYPERFAKVYGDDRITIRIFSVLLNLRLPRMKSILHKLSNYDRNLRNFTSRMTSTKTFRLFDAAGNIVIVNIPFSRVMEFGWKIL